MPFDYKGWLEWIMQRTDFFVYYIWVYNLE